MNQTPDFSHQPLVCLCIGLAESWRSLVADLCTGIECQQVESLEAARSVIEALPPGLVVVQVEPGPAAQESLSQLRRYVGESLIFAIAGQTWEQFPAEVDDAFEMPREQVRLVMRIATSLPRLEVQRERRIRTARLAHEVDRYDMAFFGSDDGLWDAEVYYPDWFDDNNRVWFSTRFKSLFGFEDDEFGDCLGDWKQRVHEADQLMVYRALDAHLHQRETFDIEYRVLNKRGDVIWLRGLGQAAWDRNGLPVRMAGSIRDITARKKAEEERDRFFQHSLDMFCYATVEGYFIEVNPAFTHVLGYSREELLSRPFLEFVHPEDIEATLEEIKKLKSGMDVLLFENRYVRKDGTTRWLAWRTPAPDASGTLFAVARDITQRKLSEQALERERTLLKEMLEQRERDLKLVSYEIHDGVVQQVTAAKMHLETFLDARDNDSERAERNLLHALDLLPAAVNEARRVISGLRPPALDDLGLEAGIAYLAEQAQSQRTQVTFDPEEDLPELPKSLEDTLFRVAQESLTNAMRHSQSDQVEISLTHERGYVCLRVRDWGVGFEPRESQPGHYGLQGMRERCRLMECQLEIASLPDAGTTVTCLVPATRVPTEA